MELRDGEMENRRRRRKRKKGPDGYIARAGGIGELAGRARRIDIRIADISSHPQVKITRMRHRRNRTMWICKEAYMGFMAGRTSAF